MLKAITKLIRPHQWTKNGLCLAGVIFSGNFANKEALFAAFATAGVFSLGSSAVYIVNDILDRELDRKHPKKRTRPIASGEIGVLLASVLVLLLAAGAFVGAWFLHPNVFISLLLYVTNGMVYSTLLKHLALLDVLGIAVGFVLRLVGGIYAVGEVPTAWISLCTFFMAVFLGFAKRRAELSSRKDSGKHQRPVLSKYSVSYLDSLLNSAATLTIMSYALFTVAADKNHTLILTLPIVYYAILHYKSIVLVKMDGEEPDRILLKDRRVILSIALWLVTYIAVDYSDVHLFR